MWQPGDHHRGEGRFSRDRRGAGGTPWLPRAGDGGGPVRARPVCRTELGTSGRTHEPPAGRCGAGAACAHGPHAWPCRVRRASARETARQGAAWGRPAPTRAAVPWPGVLTLSQRWPGTGPAR